MLKINNLYFIFFCALLLSGCATTANYQKVVNNWRGNSAQNLINCWGDPDAKVKLPNGHTDYLYIREHIANVPNQAPAPATYTNVGTTPIQGHGFSEFSGITRKLYCHTLFEVNDQGIIVSSRFQGNNCVSNRASGLIP